MDRIPDWKLPDGVDRALWEYMHDHSIAWDYDSYFSETQLLHTDRAFLESHFTEPGRLIDLGCGTGRLLVSFALNGFDCTGVDLSAEMLAVAAEKRTLHDLDFDLKEANLCEMTAVESGSYDYACCMFSTLGMIVGIEARRRALSEIRRVLKPGGKFGLHLHNRWYNAWNPQGRRWLLSDLWKQWRRLPEAGDKVQARYRGIPNVRLHLYTAREIRRELKSAGFQPIELQPLAPNRRGELASPAIFPGLRANGWLIMAQRLPG